MGEVLGLARPISMSGIISTTPNNSLGASGGGNWIANFGFRIADLIRAAASTQSLGG
jgi:hypothetical protein